jgi:hypothetical protein
MKTMKLGIVAMLVLSTALQSCKDEFDPEFVAHENTDTITFVNTFEPLYLISQATRSNLAERISWTEPNYGVQVNVNYEVQGAITSDFTGEKTIGTTSNTMLPILVSDLLAFAVELGLDDDPNTTDTNGLPNNTGIVYLRIKASLGSAQPTHVSYSAIQPISISIIEQTNTTSCDTLYAVGAALTAFGWNFPGAKLVCNDDVQTAKIALQPGHFKFFKTVNDWSSGLGYNHYLGQGYTIDALFEAVNDVDDNFNFKGTAGLYTITVDNKNKKITLTPSTNLWAVGDAVPGGWSFSTSTVELVESPPNVWSASITLNAGIFRFFPYFNDWNTSYNHPYYANQGYTIDADFVGQVGSDENFTFIGTPGTYVLTIDANAKTITLN